MSDGPSPGTDDVLAGVDAFDGFDLQVLVDRSVYAAGETVRISVTATNHADRFVEHEYPGWQRFVLTVRDEHGRPVADDELQRPAPTPARDRWVPGQMAIWPTWWHQTAGAIVAARAVAPPAPRVEPGRYRVRATWLGREAGSRVMLPDAFSPWFEIV